MALDTTIYDVALEILNCAVTGLAGAGLPAPCRACVVPGEVAWDDCSSGGQLAITTTATYYSTSFPADASEDAVTSATCTQGMVVASYEISLVRCIPGPKGNPVRAPTCEALSEAALLQHRDSYALRTSILCCLADLQHENVIVEYRVGRTETVGPEGNCGGSVIAISVGFVNA